MNKTIPFQLPMLSKSIILSCLLLSSFFLLSCSPPPPQFASASVVGALSGEADEAFARAYEPVEFQFPRDHGAHPEYQTEWWYYTGNLESSDGDIYGYQLTFFRSALSPGLPERSSDWATNQIYLSHFAVTDGSAEQHLSFERFSRGAGGLAGASGEPAYEVWLEEWSVKEIEPGVYHLLAETAEDGDRLALDLILKESRVPLLHGDQGLSQKGEAAGNASYYYSLVQMESSGTVTSNGRTQEVSGISWMDHEYGTSALSEDAVGWDWFSVQLESGIVFMFAQIRTSVGEAQEVFEGTIGYPDGSQVAILPGDFSLASTDEWSSDLTGITYPSGWQATFPDLNIELTIEPLIKAQEMQVGFTYWEGAVLVDGLVDGEAVAGRGYVELTGYGAGAGEYQR